MELILARAVLTVYCIFAAFALAEVAYKDFRQKNKITFEVFTDAVWSLGHIVMPYIISTDVHGLCDTKTAYEICLALFTFMFVLYFIQAIIATVKKFKIKKYVTGIGMVIVCILFAILTSIPPLILYHIP